MRSRPMNAGGPVNRPPQGRCLHLAGGAVPRPAPRDTRLLDRVAAPRARLSFSAVHPELGLHRALGAVGPAIVAESGALPRDPEPKRPPNAAHERAELLLRELVSRSERMKPRPP